MRDFTNELGSASPAPGGGSVAALCGALGAALSAMVSRLTLGKEKYRDAWKSMDVVEQNAERMTDHFLKLVQEDADAYQQVVAAIKLPKQTEVEQISRRKVMQEAMKSAAKVPLKTLRASEKLLLIAKEAVELGNPNTITDAAAAVQLARTTAVVAAYNVRINLPGLVDDEFVISCKEEVENTLQRIEALVEKMDDHINRQLK